MAKPTKAELISQKKFLARQKVYERKYQKQFYWYLNSINRSIATDIEDNGLYNLDINSHINEDKLTAIYEKLYFDVSINEAKITYKDEIKPETGKKDLITDLIAILGFGKDEGVLINLWRSLLKEFIIVRIAGRITNVNDTTRRHLALIIQKGISEGLGAQQVAKLIRDDVGYNRNRSLAIARTETITAGNQGKYIAASSSDYVMVKRWIPAMDARTRISHRGMYDTPFIEMEQNFWVANDKGMIEPGLYPCAETFSASNTINCRCSISFKIKRDERGNIIAK